MALNREKALAVIESMYELCSLRKSLELHAVSAKSFHELLSTDPSLETKYMHAQAAIAETIAEEIIEIADLETDAQRARNRIDTRRWYAGKIKPHKFGDRIDLNINQTIDIGSALLEAKKRLLPLTQPIDVTNTITPTATGLEPVDARKTEDVKKNTSEEEDILS